jgi:phosphoglycerate dehydrogenase-like enzyme
MRVIAWSQNLTAARAADPGASLVAKDQQYQQADLITIHLMLSDQTRALVGTGEPDLKRPSANSVSTSWRLIINEAAPAIALAEGMIADTALDGYRTETSLAYEPIRQLPQGILTPHIGYLTRGEYHPSYRQIVDDIAAFLSGRPIRLLTG